MPEWLKKAVFYEIYPQSFFDANGDGIGDINGIAQKLEYIQGLGCNAIWINPCFDSPFMDAGYDVRDYKKVAPRYGTNEDLTALFEKAHRLGMHVLLDLVPGHTSEEHAWFKESCKAQKSEFTNRYVWTNSVWENPKEYHFITGRAQRDGNYMVNFFSTQPALNYGFAKITQDWQLPTDHPDCIASREAIKDVIRFWLDRGCDGFRVDMAGSLVKNDDENRTATGAIWKNIRQMLDQAYPQAALVAEWCHPEQSLPAGFHCDFFLNEKGNGYYSLLRDVDAESGEPNSFFRAKSHGDVTKFLDEYQKMHRDAENYGYVGLITCNHDTERLGGSLTAQEMKLAYAFLFTLPSIPFLYYGDEIGMRYRKGMVSKEGGYFRTGTRTPMQWTDGRNAGFSEAPAQALYLPVDDAADAPNVEQQMGDPDSLYETVKSLLALRSKYADLGADAPFEVLFAEKNTCPLLYRRGRFVMALNPSEQAASAPIAVHGKNVFSIGAPTVVSETAITVPPQSFSVIAEDAVG